MITIITIITKLKTNQDVWKCSPWVQMFSKPQEPINQENNWQTNWYKLVTALTDWLSEL